MAHAFIMINEGTGKQLGHYDRVVNGQTIYEQKVLQSEPVLATYTVSVTTAASLNVANSHVLQLMAGGTNAMILRRLRVSQAAGVDNSQVVVWQLLRLTTAGTGGTAYTPRALDSADAVADSSAMALPTAKGTESFILWTESTFMWKAPPGAQTTPTYRPEMIFELDFTSLITKGIRVPASAGLALKNITAAPPAGGTVHVWAEFVERDWN